MCVIIVKPAGFGLPSDEILKAAYMANPDGCGFATPGALFKSLSFNAFMKNLKKVARTGEPCIIHFRLATHGSVKRANCHPFKKEDVCFAHNGILGIRPKGDMTDSETAFLDYIYPTIEEFGIDSPMVDLTVKQIIGYSKFAILQGERLRLFGDYIRQGDGCYYSNLRFECLLGIVRRDRRKEGFRITPCSGWQ